MSYKIKVDGLEVKTSDGKNVIGSDFNVQIKELDTQNRSFWAVGSSENTDRDGDIIMLDGWDYGVYMTKNPVGLWCHDYRKHPHFKTLELRKDLGKRTLDFNVKFDTHPEAEITWNQYQNGFLNSFSVGFNPLEHSFVDESQGWSSGMRFLRQELLELSAVPVPANSDANIMRDFTGSEIVTLKKLGYSDEKTIDDKNGTIWIPVDSMEAYIEPKVINILPGLKAVSANPRYRDDHIIRPVVGYFFDREYFDDKSAKNWVFQNSPGFLQKKYFQISMNNGFEFKLSTEMKEMKSMDEKNRKDDMPMEDDPMMPEGCPCKGESEKECPETCSVEIEGCRKPRKEESGDKNINEDAINASFKLISIIGPISQDQFEKLSILQGFNGEEKKSLSDKISEKELWKENKNEQIVEVGSVRIFVQVLDNQGKVFHERSMEFNEVEVKEACLQIFDKSFYDNLKKEMIEEIKKEISGRKEQTEEPSEKIDDFINLDEIEFPVSQKSEDDEIIEIETEELKMEVKNTLEDTIKNTFQEAIKSMSGNLEDK